MEDMAFDDLILESVQSVTKAATSLINAATVAQKVLVAQGKMSKNAKKVLLVRILIQTYTNFLLFVYTIDSLAIGTSCSYGNFHIQTNPCYQGSSFPRHGQC